MNDAVDRLLVEREAMDRGFPAGVVLSVGAHLFLVAGSLLVALLAPKTPLIQVADGFSVALPAGGGGVPNAQPPAPAVTQPEAPPATEAAAAPAPPPKILKPPKEEKRKGLPEPDAKRSKKVEKTPPAVPRGGVAGTGTSNQTPGLDFGPPGPGIPGGTDMLGDWYMAGVQRKIWVLWTQQIRPPHTQPVVVRVSILADGSVTDVDVIQTCGISLVDRAAERAVLTAAPFGPLPRSYGTDRYTFTATFHPTE